MRTGLKVLMLSYPAVFGSPDARLKIGTLMLAENYRSLTSMLRRIVMRPALPGSSGLQPL